MKLKIITTIFSLFLSTQLSAQYVGPGSQASYKNIQDILSNPVDDAFVVLEGYITKQLNSEKYLFTDGKSEIRIEIDKEKFPIGLVNEKTKLRITGEVEKDFLESVEIDADFVEIL